MSDADATTTAPCGGHPITEDCCCLCHQAGRKDERQRIRDGSVRRANDGRPYYSVPADLLDGDGDAG